MTEAFALLVERGHKHDDLFGKYTIDQVWAFYDAVVSNQRKDFLQLAISVRTAHHAREKEWKDYVEHMTMKFGAEKKTAKGFFDKLRGIQRRLNRGK